MLDRFLCILATAGEEEYELVFMILLWYPGKCRRNILFFQYSTRTRVHSQPAIPDLNNLDSSLLRMNSYEFNTLLH